ncbi:MAG: aldose 1-epimerase family protein [Prevotella sp.]
MITISNPILSVSISEHGAELQSIRKDGKEYLWQGDGRFWGRRSPVLFPFVGRVWNNVYRHEGTVYEMGQHGFARDMDFNLVSADADAAAFVLESTPETLMKYPFPFRLRIDYRLDGNAITVGWHVENTGTCDLHFQIGAHPAFYFPELDLSTDARSYFAFDRSEGLEYISPAEKGCTSPERHVLDVDVDGLMQVDVHTFDCDTYIFDNHQLSKVTLLDKSRRPYVSLEFDAPLVALWSPTKTHPDCPFVCIEPWYGRCDTVGYEGDLEHREWMQHLKAGRTFDARYKIIL